MQDFLSYVDGLQSTTLATAIMLVLAGAYIMHFILDSLPMTATFAAMFMLGGLLADYLAKASGMYLSTDPDANLLMLLTIGMIVGLLATVFTIRIYTVATDHTKTKARG